MFEKILIANRGEIAVRIMQTCKRLGVRTVAVYSDADTRSLHRHRADEAVHIGGASSQESYLDMEKLLSVAQDTGCQAVHPGYGFLSENPYFARSVHSAGLVFIGPPASAIEAMGDKIASKDLAVKAGVPVIPGHGEPVLDEDQALAIAGSIGYPVLLKPAAGGGGKGMRIVSGPDEMEGAFSASRQEARKAFGDARVFLERYIERPRHVEMQILADADGSVIHLGERECSVQRRYQKVIEEAPSPALSQETRQRMGQAACNLARQTGYVNAGTVEFVLEGEEHFYFLEMNTRLQVEHPVTEMITGLDLVEIQLEIANGGKLPLRQEEVNFNGWAIEARICAEDPKRDFMPSTGMISRYAEPRGGAVRVDSGVGIGSAVGIYYDSMLAKVVYHGKDRDSARLGLVEALNGYHIEGVVTNIDFVNSILCHPEFIKATLFTGFIGEHFEGGRPLQPQEGRYLELAALASTVLYHVRTAALRNSLEPMVSRIGGSRDQQTTCSYKVKAENDIFDVELVGSPQGRRWMFEARVNGRSHQVETPPFEFYRRRLKLWIDGEVHRFRMRLEKSFIFVAFCGISRLFEVYTTKEWRLMHYMPISREQGKDNALACPMPGQVIDVLVKKGDRVFRGQNLMILESMKMESNVASPVDGIVASVHVGVGQTVETDEILVQFE